MSGTQRYQLSARRAGTALFGLSVPQVALMAVGILAAVRVLTAGGPTAAHFAIAAGSMAAAAAVSFTPWGGCRVYEMIPAAARFGVRAALSENRWLAAVPPVGVDGRPLGKAELPRCLSGLEIRGVNRPAWAGVERSMAPLGLAVDRRSGVVTAVVAVKGSEFQLVTPAEQHFRIARWGMVLAQFAREAAPIARVCWHDFSCPAPLEEHLTWLRSNSNPAAPAAGGYQEMMAGQSSAVARHELRVTITVDPRRLRRRRIGARAKRDAIATTVQLLQVLTQRCRAADLIVAPPLSPAQIAEAVRVQGDPNAIRSLPRSRGLGERAGLVPVAFGPLAMDAAWDSVVIDSAWHRVFWVQAWPTVEVPANWIEPLLLDTLGTRTITMIMEPVDPVSSRRHLSKESVGLEASIDMRERKQFRVPADLHRARADLDRREDEITSGFAEYQYLALIDISARSADELDELTGDYITVAAQCGLELRALDGRHDAAWACTIPVGRAPDKDIIGAVKG